MSMRIIGIDPGIARLGWGVIEEKNNKIIPLNFGCFETPKSHTIEKRLLAIFNFLEQLFEKYQPDALSVEELFFNKNVSTALTVGQARGVAILAGAKHNIPLHSFTPLQVKMALTGYGRAEKSQIGHMVKTLLYLNAIPKPDDTADALAIAITYAFTHKLKTQSEKCKI